MPSIGQGAFSDVYEARLAPNRVPNRVLPVPNASSIDLTEPCNFNQVIIKVARSRTDINYDGSLGHSQEVALYRRLPHHVHISQLYGVFHSSVPHIQGIVLEYIDRDLFQYAIQYKDDFNTLRNLACQICESIGHLHDNDIIHGDINPGNIRVRGDGTIAVTDLGLGRREGGQSYPSTVQGLNPRYVAPELLTSQSFLPTKPSDVFALSMVLLQLLNCSQNRGRSGDLSIPYNHIRQSHQEIQLLLQVIRGETPRMERYTKTNDPALVVLFQQCWQWAPASRPRVHDVLQTLS